MINLLMRQPPIILQQIILLRPRRLDQLLRDRLYHHPKRSTNQSFPSKDLDVECGANERGGDVPESQPRPRRGCRSISRRGIWGL